MIDLHLHLDGSLMPELVLKLAKKQEIKLPAENAIELKKYLTVPHDCESLNDYLKCFDLPLSVMQTKEAISDAVYELQEYLKKQGLIYAEIRFAPQLHKLKGLTQIEVVEAALEGLNRSDFDANLILCCMRGDNNKAENLETVELAKKYLGKGVCALDLAGAEALFKTETFKDIFERARELNIPFTIHAGEADGPESVKKAIEFGAKRIGHGVKSIFDEELLNEIKEKQIPLEVCPTSNFQTKTLGTFEEYPIRKLMDMGIKLTINTDNMTVSNTTIFDEYKFLMEHFGFTKEEILQCMNNSIDVAFALEKTKEKLREKLNYEFENKKYFKFVKK